jgi:release factor glutamine methyltransferase
MPTWTIARVQEWTSKDFAARGLPSPRLEADLLVCHALGLRRVDLYVRFDQPLSADELSKVRALVERRRRHEPVAYITGSRGFYGRTFAVDPRVLVPRPETELLVELALEALPPLGAEDSVRAEARAPLAARRILDVGTGSGALAITLACEREDVLVDAVDASQEAIDVARSNVVALSVEGRVRLLCGSLYEPIASELEAGLRYAVIVSNPPYIASNVIETLMPDVRLHEPRVALDGGPSGLDVIRPLILGARRALEPGGLLLIEIGHDQGESVLALARDAGFNGAKIKKDLAGLDRALIATAP